MNYTEMSIGERILAIRKERKLSQEAFGEKLGVTGAAVSRVEKGERGASEQMKKSICREFGVSYMFLVDGEGEMFIDDDNDTLSAIDRIMAGENEFHKKLLKWVATSFSDEELQLLEKKIDEFIDEFSDEKEG